MARWLSFSAECNFSVQYKPGRLNVVAEALLLRPDFEPTAHSNSEINPSVSTLVASVPSSTLLYDVIKSYAGDKDLLRLMDHFIDTSRKSVEDVPALYRFSSDRYTTRNVSLYYTAVAGDTPCVVVTTNNKLRSRIMYGCHHAYAPWILIS